jgi:DNA-binding response OmpR family regulator
MAGSKILFVDDEPAIRVTLPMILQIEGFEVTTAATVAEAVQHIAREQFDVLLTDLNIGQPGDGFTVASAMRRTQPEAITLILTGFPDFETAIRALREQVDDYFTKPADIKQLVANIRQRLAAPRRTMPMPLKRVSQVLRENAEAIISEWLRDCSEDIELSCVPLSRKERLDHLPLVLTDLADRVEADRFEASPQTNESASKHGTVRRAQGYRAWQIVSEGRILHAVISRALQEHLLSIDLSTIISDMMRIGEALGESLEKSIQAFEEAPVRRRA